MMPRYFFDTHDGELATPDEIGIDLTTREDVESTVRDLLFDLGHAELLKGADRTFTAIVRNAEGAVEYRGSLTLRIDACYASVKRK